MRQCEVDSRSAYIAVSGDLEISRRHLPGVADAKVNDDAVAHSRDIGFHKADKQQPARLCRERLGRAPPAISQPHNGVVGARNGKALAKGSRVVQRCLLVAFSHTKNIHCFSVKHRRNRCPASQAVFSRPSPVERRSPTATHTTSPLEIETCRSVQALLLGVYSPTVSSGMLATVHPLRQFA